MKHVHVFASRQVGFSLIELMVSLTIGLIIMLATIATYLGTAGANRTAEAIGRMNEDAQMALIILTQQLRMAGVNPSQPDRSTVVGTSTNARGNLFPVHNGVANAYAIRGCDLKFSDITSAASTVNLTCAHTASSTGPDSIAIAYEADKYNTVATGTGVPTDCLGSGLTATSSTVTTSAGTAATTTFYEAENRFFVGTSTYVVNPTLYCKGNAASTNAQPLVENIEDLQIKYGTTGAATGATTSTTATMVLGYLTAYEVDNSASVLNATGSAEPTGTSAGSIARWNHVITVRLCVVARSESEVLDSTASAKYVNCDGTLITPTDKRMRRAYTTTVVLRNK